jgi:hypothetical protein
MTIDSVAYANGQYTITGEGFTTNNNYLYVLIDNYAYTPDSYTDDTILLTISKKFGSEFRIVNEKFASNVFEDKKDIIFEFVGDSFQIPTCGRKNYVASTPYAWDVYIDDVFKGSYSGVSADASTGISVSGLASGAHIVGIMPTDGLYSVGWGCAFGFWTGTSGLNNATNRNKFTRAIQDPDWAHLYTATNTGTYFRRYTYYGTTNLVQFVPETMPDSVTIGTYFRRSQYYLCPNLKIGSYVHDKNFAKALNGGTDNYSWMFCLDTAIITPDEMPKYTKADGTLAPVTDLTPSNDRNYVQNRTGITGYSSLNSYWK